MKEFKEKYKKELRDLLIATIFFIIIVIIFLCTLNKNIKKPLSEINKYSKVSEKEIKKVANIKIEKIKLDDEVYNDASIKTLKNHIGHDENSFYPGDNKTIILTAYNNLAFKYI